MCQNITIRRTRKEIKMKLANDTRSKHLSSVITPRGNAYPYEIISRENYTNAPNELTEAKLKNLVALANAIEEPHIFGKFNNEEHYLKTLSLVLSSTHETRNRILFFLKDILPIITSKKSLLDVGPGDGRLTRILARYFAHVTAVDSNSHILRNLNALLSANTSYHSVNKNILDADLVSEAYDCAVVSHILYYINREDWDSVIKNLYRSLTKNGILVVVLGGDELDKADLIHNFNGNNLKIDHLVYQCMEFFGQSNVSAYASDEVFMSLTNVGMLHIAAFMLADAGVTAHKVELVDYINSNLKNPRGHFEMTTRQKFILIRKP